MQFCFILGNHPHLSAWEIIRVLESQKKEYSVVKFQDSFLVLDLDFTQEEMRIFSSALGGTIKVGVVEEMGEQLQMEWIFSFLEKRCQEFGKKYSFGLSVYDATKQLQSFDKTGIQLKKQLKEKGYSARFVRGMGDSLSSVTVAVNGLTGEKGDELVFVNGGDRVVIARTIFVQAYEEWGQRDFGKPKRDMQVGMMPPKLARMMINISGASKESVLLDPFCGMGTVLLEAASLGFKQLIAMDIEEDQIASTKENVAWLQENQPALQFRIEYLRADVRQIAGMIKDVGSVVTEPYLGKIKRGNESVSEMKKEMEELHLLYTKAIQQVSSVLRERGVMVMIIPRFKIGREEYTFDLKNVVKESGLQEVVPPSWINTEELTYRRAGQQVWREIHVFEKV